MATKIPIKYKIDPHACYAMWTLAQNLAVHEVVCGVKVINNLTLPEKWAKAQMMLDSLEKAGMYGVSDTIVSEAVFVALFSQQERNLVNSYSFYSEKDGTIKFKLSQE
jgi:hypothetical protein